MIAANLSGRFIHRYWQSHFKFCWNSGGARQADKKRVKVGAVSALGVAGPDDVAVAAAGRSLVVGHVGDHVIVNRAGLIEISSLAGNHRGGEFLDAFIERHQAVGLQPAIQISLRGRSAVRYFRKTVMNVFTTANRKHHGYGNVGHFWIPHIDVHDLVSILRVGEDFRWRRRAHLALEDLLIVVALRIGEPDFDTLAIGGDPTYLRRVGDLQSARLRRTLYRRG